MQTILGANGVIGEELARELNRNYSNNLPAKIRLVGRNPVKVNPTDILFKADLLDAKSTIEALNDTKTAYLTAGLPNDSAAWRDGWPTIMHNVIIACIENNCRLVYFDNTYAYSQDTKHQTENTPLTSTGEKGKAKAVAAKMLIDAIEKKQIEACICRSPEFYGTGKTKGITNSLIFENLRNGKKPKVFVSDSVLRTLIFTSDAARAFALIGNTHDAYGQTWHLPCDDNRLTYKQIINIIEHKLQRHIEYEIIDEATLKQRATQSQNVKETLELLPRYAIDNIFDSSKFKTKFPEFKVTNYADGIAIILKDLNIS